MFINAIENFDILLQSTFLFVFILAVLFNLKIFEQNRNVLFMFSSIAFISRNWLMLALVPNESCWLLTSS